MNVVHAPAARAGAGASVGNGTRAAARTAGAASRTHCKDLMLLLHPAKQIIEAQPPYHPRRFPDDAAVHLGDSGPAVHEHDRDLLDSKALLPALERHLDLKRVAIRFHTVE